jgi:hypothetical protein
VNETLSEIIQKGTIYNIIFVFDCIYFVGYIDNTTGDYTVREYG